MKTREKYAVSHKSAISVLFGALLLSAGPLFAGQARGSPPKSGKTAKDSRSAKKLDACALLTSAEIEAVQGEPVKETKPSVQPSSNFLTSQCFFRTATFAKSVSLALFMPDPDKPFALTPRAFWQIQFHPPDQPEKDSEKETPIRDKREAPSDNEAEREKELRKARAIAGLGEEAYWMGNPITGALYVLQGDFFLRISIGGVREEDTRIEKSKALARAALHRLRSDKGQHREEVYCRDQFTPRPLPTLDDSDNVQPN